MVAIPEKFYVTRVYRSAEEVLGWMVVADKEHTKAFQESKKKADAWATPYTRYGQTTPEPGMDPIYVDNTPRTGFRMVTNVSRYSTSNVVWRIMHPEGFEFEITSDNLCDLLETNTIVEGEFQDELFFTHNKKLVNEKTKLFADLIAREEKKKEQKEKAKEMFIGTTLIYNHYNGNRKFQYCGKVHAITVNANKPYKNSTKSSLRLVVKENSTGKYHLLSSISNDFTVIDQYEHDDIDINEVSLAINEQIKTNDSVHKKYWHTGYIPGEIIPLVTSTKPFTKEQLHVVYKEISTDNFSCITTDKVYLYNHSMIFGFAWRGSYSYEESHDTDYYKTNYKITHLRTYPISGYDEKGNPTLDIDISEHKYIGSGRESIFNSIRNEYSGSGHKLNTVDIPNTIMVGHYVIGE